MTQADLDALLLKWAQGVEQLKKNLEMPDYCLMLVEAPPSPIWEELERQIRRQFVLESNKLLRVKVERVVVHLTLDAEEA